MTEAYHTKYRPRTLEQVYGQAHVVTPLKKLLAKGSSQVFLFAGPSGTGKTTLARIVATMVGCSDRDVMDVDAATFSGINEMRSLQEIMKYRPIGGGESRAIIIDECHGLSKNAWDALLKTIEEPNANVYWFFCTTNPAKVPVTVKTRASSFTLKAVSESEIERVVDRVMDKEDIDLSDGVVQIICRQANGSPRQALTNLAMCEGVKTAKEASAILHAAQEGDATLEFCRFVVSGGSWAKAMVIMTKLKDENPEGIRILTVNYLAAVLRGTKGDPLKLLAALEAFSTPYNAAEGFAPLYLSLGRAIYD